jgi:hypothetical protein
LEGEGIGHFGVQLIRVSIDRCDLPSIPSGLRMSVDEVTQDILDKGGP